MKIQIIVEGGGYDGLSHIKDIPDNSRLNEIESLGIPVADGRTANFPTISVSRKQIILDGNKLRWERWMKKIPLFFQGGDYEGKTGVFEAENEVDIYALKEGGSFNVNGIKFPILDASASGLLLDGSNSKMIE